MGQPRFLFDNNRPVFSHEHITGEKPSYKVMLARFPQGRKDDPDTTNWLMRWGIECYNDPRIHTLFTWQKDDTPVDMSRNACVEAAKECGADFILMIDSDMSPDIPVNYAEAEPKPFWKSSFDFAIEQRKAGNPCVIGAPYCGPSPHQNVYVFLWRKLASGKPDTVRDLALTQYTRDDAARMTGIREVAALPTGLIIFDVEGIKNMKSPFYYEMNPMRSKKESTEDVTCTRDLSLVGVKQYCNWDAWAGHWKWECVGKPDPVSPDWVASKIQEAMFAKHNINKGEELIDVKPGNSYVPPTRPTENGERLATFDEGYREKHYAEIRDADKHEPGTDRNTEDGPVATARARAQAKAEDTKAFLKRAKETRNEYRPHNYEEL